MGFTRLFFAGCFFRTVAGHHGGLTDVNFAEAVREANYGVPSIFFSVNPVEAADLMPVLNSLFVQ